EERLGALGFVLLRRHHGEPGERPRDGWNVVPGPEESEVLLKPLFCGHVVARPEGDICGSPAHPRRVDGRVLLCGFERIHEPAVRLSEEAALGEEIPGRSYQLDRQLGVMVSRPINRAADVFELGLEAYHPLR